jgi:hypothetical protein
MNLTPKQIGYARAVLACGQSMGISPLGIQIAFATVFVESNWTVYANPAVPDSVTRCPDCPLSYDSNSVGLFQQQVVDSGNGWWWGDAATCMDPYKSATLFFGRLASLGYNSGAQTPGSYAQDVQQSAFPGRYDDMMPQAIALYNHLTSFNKNAGGT